MAASFLLREAVEVEGKRGERTHDAPGRSEESGAESSSLADRYDQYDQSRRRCGEWLTCLIFAQKKQCNCLDLPAMPLTKKMFEH